MLPGSASASSVNSLLELELEQGLGFGMSG